MLQFTIYGNCQLECIKQFLLTNSIFLGQYEYLEMKLVHMMEDTDILSAYDIIQNIDLLLIQPISDNYKNNYKLSTTSVLKHIKPTCLVIILPSLYFAGYFPFTGHLSNNGDFILKPMPLHDRNLVKLYIKNGGNRISTAIQYKSLLLNDVSISNDIFLNEINKSIAELERRENEMKAKYNILNTLTYSDFIRKNYKNELLCYSDSHPTKFTFRYFTDIILTRLNIPLMPYPEDLDPERRGIMPFYKSLEKIVNFKVTDDIIINNHPVTIDIFIDQYLDVYSRYDLNELKKFS